MGGRLLLAFLGISAFAVIAALAALYSFAEVGRALDRITRERVPGTLAALELSRQAERIVSAAPALLAVDTKGELRDVSEGIATEVRELEQLVANLGQGGLRAGALAQIEPAVEGLRRNLAALDGLMAQRLDIAARRQARLDQLSSTTIATMRLLAPGILVMDSKAAQWRRADGEVAADASARRAATAALGEAISAYLPQQKAHIEASAINETLLKAAAARTPSELPLHRLRLQRSLAALEALASDLEAGLGQRLRAQVDDLRGLVDGTDSILDARQAELGVIAEAESLLAENATLSRELTAAVDRLVGGARQDIANAAVDANSVQRLSTGVLLTVVILSLASSALIVWLYVGRNLIARLTALSDSMLAIAGGDLRARLPAAGSDEIGRMAQALVTFRDTAAEVEEQRLRERQVVLDTIDYGVLILGPDLRVRIFNRAFLGLSGLDDAILRARPDFREIMERSRERGIYGVPDADWPDYVETRLAELRAGEAAAREWQLADGRVVEYQCVPLPDGGRMLTYFDLTRLKQTEDELRAAKERAELASRAKSDFLASMSHELRTPLNAIIGISEMLQEDAAEEGRKELDEPLGRVLKAGKLLLQLINEVLDLAKIEAGKLELHPEDTDLAALLRDTLGTAEPLAEKNRNRLVLDIAARSRPHDDRPDAAAPDRPQPALQRLPLHRGRHRDADRAARAGRRRRAGCASPCATPASASSRTRWASCSRSSAKPARPASAATAAPASGSRSAAGSPG